MRIHKEAKLEKIVSKDEQRGALQHINIVAGDPDTLGMDEVFGRAVATDGRKLVMVPVTLEEDDLPGVITPESLVACRKLTNPVDKLTSTRMLLGDQSVIADNTATFPRKSTVFLEHTDDGVRVKQDDAPEMDHVAGQPFPSIKTIDAMVPKELDAIGKVTVNPKFLLEVAEAIGSKECVDLFFYQDSLAIRVGGKGAIEGAVGVLMPIRGDSGAAGFELLGLPAEIKKETPEAGAADEDQLPGTEPISPADEALIKQAIEILRETSRASASSLQRRLKVGYTRAARLIDLLEERGIVGPPIGSGPREILKLPNADDREDATVAKKGGE